MLESLKLARQYGLWKVELSVDSKSKVVVQTLCSRKPVTVSGVGNRFVGARLGSENMSHIL